MFEDTKETIAIIRQSLRPMRLSRWQTVTMVAQHLLREMSISQIVIFSLVSLVTVYFAYKTVSGLVVSRRDTWLGMPRLVMTKEQHDNDLEKLVEDAARKYPDRPYVIAPGGFDWVIFPSSTWDEIKRIPESAASLRTFHHAVFHGKWTGFGQESDAMLTMVSVDLARGAQKKVHERQEDAARAIARYVGRCDDWTDVELFNRLFDIATNITACSFVGRDIGNTDAWINANRNFPVTVMIASFILGAIPDWFGQWLAPLLFLPTMKVQWDAKKTLRTVLAEDETAYDKTTDKTDLLSVVPGRKLPITPWLLNRSKQRPSVNNLINDYLLLSLEATSTQSALTFSTLTELALRPDLVEILRNEIEEVSQDGKLPLGNLGELRIMDSVIRESIRVNEMALFSLHRRLREPVQLSMGPLLPAGTFIAVDAHSINQSTNLWKDPSTFDPMRFVELRKDPANDSKYSFAALNSEWPIFGDGAQSCPGRIYGSSNLKILISTFIMNYDIKLRPGEGKPKRAALPNGTLAPDLKTKFLFRSRKTAPWGVAHA